MSKFIEELKRHTQLSPAPLGFGRGPVHDKPRISLVACLAQTDIENLSEYLNITDAVLIQTDSLLSLNEKLAKLSQYAPDVILGGWLVDARWDKIDNIKVAGDFLVFNSQMPLLELPVGLGRVIELDMNITDTQLRAIDELPVEAVLLNTKPAKLSWQNLITLQRLNNLLSKPLLAIVPCGVTTTELQTLWTVGVDGVVIEVETESAKKLDKLRQEVEATSFPLPRKSKKVNVTLPFISQRPSEESEEVEDE